MSLINEGTTHVGSWICWMRLTYQKEYLITPLLSQNSHKTCKQKKKVNNCLNQISTSANFQIHTIE